MVLSAELREPKEGTGRVMELQAVPAAMRATVSPVPTRPERVTTNAKPGTSGGAAAFDTDMAAAPPAEEATSVAEDATKERSAEKL